MRLIFYEWKKLWLHRSLIWVLLGLLLFDVWHIRDTWQTSSYFADNPGWATGYWTIYDRFSGDITTDKVQSFLGFYTPYEESVQDMTFNAAIDPDSLTGVNIFSDYLMLQRYYFTPMRRMVTYRSTADSIALQAQKNVASYREKGNTYEMQRNARIYLLFQNRSIDQFFYYEPYARLLDYNFSSYLAALFIVYGLSLLLRRERESEMDIIILVSPRGGRKTLAAKVIVGFTFVLLTVATFALTDWLSFLAVYGSADGSVLPLYALAEFSETPLIIPLWQTVILYLITRFFGFCVFSLCYLFLAQRSKTILFPFLAGTATVLGLLAVAEHTCEWHQVTCKAFNPASLLIPQSLYRTSDFFRLGNYPLLTHELAFLFAVCVCATALLLLFALANKNTWNHNFKWYRKKASKIMEEI